jgi:hypothetical protein
MPNLVIRIPGATADLFPDLVLLATLAPVFSVDTEEGDDVFVAAFPHLQGPWVSINARRVTRSTRFWRALLCYRESIDEPDAHRYCATKAGKVVDAEACPDPTCQFLCSRCIGVVRGQGASSVLVQVGKKPVSASGRAGEKPLDMIAIQAEVDWCPNLRLTSKCHVD